MVETVQRPEQAYTFGPFRLTPGRQELLRDGAPVRIGGRALDILATLLERPGEVVSKRELIVRVWPGLSVEEGNLKVNMNGLRRALGEGALEPRYIATVVGRGYRFVAEVRRHSAAAPTPRIDPAGHNLPGATTRVLGRDEVIAAIARDLADARLLSVVGAGGIGKTTVALAVAEPFIGRLRDGVWLVDLSPLRDPALVVSAVASAVGLAAHPVDPLSALANYLRGREMLLVVDNCEHLIEAVAVAVSRILAEAPAVRILVTSREPLRVRGERVRRLVGLAVPPAGNRMTAAEVRNFAAVELFVERATDRVEDFTLDDSDAPLVAEICRRLDGLALAIELAATRVDTFGARGLLQQLDDRFALLEGHRGGVERHRTLTATIDWSYALLSEADRRVMRRLAVFPGTFSLASAAAVVGEGDGAVTGSIASLVAKSLLFLEAGDDNDAYRLLNLTRAFALDRLRESGEEDGVRRRHADHIAEVLATASREWPHRAAPDWGRAYGGFLDDLRDALDWAAGAGADPALLIRLSVVGSILWNHLSLIEEGRARAARALREIEAAGLGGSAGEMQLQVTLAGATIFARGALLEVRALLDRAIATARRRGDVDYQLRCLRMIGSYELFIGNPDAKTASMEAFLALAEVAEPAAVPYGLSHLALGEMFLGRIDIAWSRLTSDPPVRPESHGPRYARFFYDRDTDVGNVRSHVEWLRGMPETALRTSEANIALARESGHTLSLSHALALACMISFLAGEHGRCRAWTAMLGDVVERNGVVMWRPVVTFCRGAVAEAEKAGSALDLFAVALEDFRATRHMVRLPLYMATYAKALVLQGRHAAAEFAIGEAMDLAEVQKEYWILPEVLRLRAAVVTADAEAALTEAMAHAAATGALMLRLRAASDLAALVAGEGRTNEAKAILEPVLGAFTEGFATSDLVRARTILNGLGR